VTGTPRTGRLVAEAITPAQRVYHTRHADA